MTQKYVISPSWQNDVIEAQYGTLPSGDNNSIDSAGIAFDNLQNLLNRSIAAGSTFNVPMISTYTLGVGIGSVVVGGGVINGNGDIY